MGQNVGVTGSTGKLGMPPSEKQHKKKMQATQRFDYRKLYLGRERKEGLLFKSVQEPEFAFVYEDKKLAGELKDW